MQSLFQKYRHALWFLLFGALSAFYFVSQHLGLRYHVVHLPLDDWLPFWPGFIVFYVLWYFYVPGCMLWACFRARDVFYRQVAALFSGAFVCAAVFVLYPTCVDFRPSAAGPGLARALCRLIYANDAPVNVFPSLHCYEALVMHLATFRVPPLRVRKRLRLASAVLVILICLSTLLIKQHSAADLIAGCALAVAAHSLTTYLFSKRRSHHDHLLLLAFAAGAVVLLWALLRGRSERCRAAVLIALCAVNIIGFFVYKGFLSRDVQFLQASGLDRFNWFNELPLQLCNINMFLIPIGILTHRRSLLGFAFFVAPLGALMALVFPEAAFSGYSLWTPRIFGFYFTHMLIIICGLSLATLGFYRPRPKDLPGIAGTFLMLGFGALLVDLLLRHTVCPLANYFFVYGGDVDISILNLFWKWLPVPFLYEMPALLILVGYMALICLLFSARDQRRAREIAAV